MIVPDINLLLYAHDSSSPFHAKAAGWWQACLSGTEPVGLLHVVTFGFVRIATNARAFVNPMTPAEAAMSGTDSTVWPCKSRRNRQSRFSSRRMFSQAGCSNSLRDSSNTAIT